MLCIGRRRGGHQKHVDFHRTYRHYKFQLFFKSTVPPSNLLSTSGTGTSTARSELTTRYGSAPDPNPPRWSERESSTPETTGVKMRAPARVLVMRARLRARAAESGEERATRVAVSRCRRWRRINAL